MNSEYFNMSPPLIKDFLGYMQNVQNKSSKTVDSYFIDLRTFFRYLKKSYGLISEDVEFEKITIDDVDINLISKTTLSDVYEFLNFTIEDRNNNAATRSRKISSLRGFFGYLTKLGIIKNNPVKDLEVPKQKKRLPKYLTLEESLELLNTVDGRYKERDYCILTLFLNCGLRLSELTGLNLSSINKSSNTLRVIGKGNKERILYLNDACMSAIENYIKVRPVDGVTDKNALFISKNYKRISPRAVENIVYKYLDKIGLKSEGYSVHKLRHTAATLMYQHGNVDVRVIQEVLGHENLGTTQIYTHLSNKQIENASKANPLSKVKQKKVKE